VFRPLLESFFIYLFSSRPQSLLEFIIYRVLFSRNTHSIPNLISCRVTSLLNPVLIVAFTENITEEIRAQTKGSGERENDFLLEILSRSWFYRMWTIQELFLARRAVVWCGLASMYWEDFAAAISILRDNELKRRSGPSGLGT
jgi:hypothetical protein